MYKFLLIIIISLAAKFMLFYDPRTEVHCSLCINNESTKSDPILGSEGSGGYDGKRTVWNRFH